MDTPFTDVPLNATSTSITPIGDTQQKEVVEQTEHFIQLGTQLFQQNFMIIPVVFDLRGRAAGMYKVTDRMASAKKGVRKSGVWARLSTEGRQVHRQIRYNPWIFAKYYENNLSVTVPHEVAHYLVDCLYGLSRVRPHGSEWKAVMDAFGVDSSVTARFDLTGIPTRQHQQFEYRCDCKIHQLGLRRHNKVMRGEANYLCRHCSVALASVGETL
ncbi:MAG: SprT-like domain-containing protein [Porticoccus sp.]|nr:SprT-like domain-containing protein [Porticoccus sp.]